MFAGSDHTYVVLRKVCQLPDIKAITFFSSREDIIAKRSAVINSATLVYMYEKTKTPQFKHLNCEVRCGHRK